MFHSGTSLFHFGECQTVLMSVSAAQQSILALVAPVLAAEPQLSLVSLADRIGVGRTTLYRHFGDSASLRAALAEYAAIALAGATQRAEVDRGTGAQALRRLCAELFDLGDVLSLLFGDEPLVSDQALTEAGSRLNATGAPEPDPLAAVLLRAQQEGTADPELPIEWLIPYTWLSLASGHLYADSPGTDRHRAFELVWIAIERTVLVPGT